MTVANAARSAIFTHTLGEGPALVMLHGWAMHGGLMLDFAQRLASRCRVTLVDLPGHGRSEPRSDYALDSLLDALMAVVPERACWLGWSLGGLLALAAAERAPRRVSGLILMAGTPRFTRSADWPGVDAEVLRQMAGHLEEDRAATLRRFIGLQTFGQAQAKDLARTLQTRLDEAPPADPVALRGGLQLLLNEDLRSALAAYSGPTLTLLGERDRLVPAALQANLHELKPDMAVHTVSGAAHLPFFTHPQETVCRVEAFLEGVCCHQEGAG